jgi:hypothetical protein
VKKSSIRPKATSSRKPSATGEGLSQPDASK